MRLKELRIEGFKSFGKRVTLPFPTNVTAIVGPNGSGKSNVAEAFRFVLGEQSMKSMRGKRGEDLIFNGGSGAAQANRAKVTVLFDNSGHVLDDTFSEVAVARTVYRDGANEYSINNAKVRHRDIIEMLAKANIGATGHHIISQGEADCILSATPEGRKEMLEDGLGLKLLQYRRTESEKKLEHAQENITQTDILLRELAPHMRYLKKQVEQQEKTKKTRKELEGLYANYLAREVYYLANTKRTIEGKLDTLSERKKVLEKELWHREKESNQDKAGEKTFKEIQSLQEKIQEVRKKKDALSQEIGRLEGELSAIDNMQQKTPQEGIQREEVEKLHTDLHKRYTMADEKEYGILVGYTLRQIKKLLDKTKRRGEAERRCQELERELEKNQKERFNLEQKEEHYNKEQEKLRKLQERATTEVRQAEKELFELASQKNTLEQEMAETKRMAENLKEEQEELRREVKEGLVLIGSAINKYKEIALPEKVRQEERSTQKERRKMLERKKIELETIGTGGGDEIYKEHSEVSERVTFLKREKKDLQKSIQDCKEGIAIIQKEIDKRFKEGVKAISKEFEKFFKILFGGGRAGIEIEKRVLQRDEEEEIRIGIGVNISLPYKKIRALEQLSGGERALVSIALLFAISQVTPPPFLILDETDAALDEANSRRYGDMIEFLAKTSQLILITHNRETMHRAGALYGVTMGTAGTSSLLSVQFDEAVQVAK